MKLFKDPQPAELTLTSFSAAIYSPSNVSSLLREVTSSFTLIMLKCLYIRDSATAGDTMEILSFGQNTLDTVLVGIWPSCVAALLPECSTKFLYF